MHSRSAPTSGIARTRLYPDKWPRILLALGWNFQLKSGRDDRPSKSVAASHAEAVDRSNILHRIGNENAHGLFAHRTAPNEPFRRRWTGAQFAHNAENKVGLPSHVPYIFHNKLHAPKKDG